MNLTHEQRVAASARGHVTVVMACPGSGKTTTLVERIKRLVQDDEVAPSNIAVMTFTTAAANELRRRVAAAVGHQSRGMFIGTLHSYCLMLARRKHESLEVLDAKASSELLDECIRKSRYRGSIEKLKLAIIECRDVKPPTSSGEHYITAKMYLDQCKIDCVADYDGLLHLGMEEIGNAEHTHLMVDEYQDSGDIDDRIYTAHPAVDKFFVGDPDQAIYGFRGGNVRNILARSMSPLHLGKNFRSTIQIAEAANKLIAHNQLRYNAKMECGTDGPRPIVIRPDDEADQLLTVIKYIDQIDRPSETVGIIARTNGSLGLFRDHFASLECGERVVRDPRDMELAAAVIGLSANPYSDRAAIRLYKAMGKDAEYIAATLAWAKINMVSLNERPDLMVPLYGMEPVVDVLARYGVRQSIDIVKDALDANPDALASDLIMAIAEPVEVEQQARIEVCTMHGAKGREWDHVFIVNAVQGITPSHMCGDDLDLEEERRLFYVAMTRAKQTLTILSPMRINNQWTRSVVECDPSQFISEAFD